jgi:hypothetical protein
VNDRMALMGHAWAEMTDRYTHEDRERMRAGVEAISSRIWKPETAANVVDIATLRNRKKHDSGNQLATKVISGANNKRVMLIEQVVCGAKGRRFESYRAYQP